MLLLSITFLQILQGVFIIIAIIVLSFAAMFYFQYDPIQETSGITVTSMRTQEVIQKRLKELNVKRVQNDDDTLQGNVTVQRIDERMDELELLIKTLSNFKNQ